MLEILICFKDNVMKYAFPSLLKTTLSLSLIAVLTACSNDEPKPAPEATGATATESTPSASKPEAQTTAGEQYSQQYSVGVDTSYPPFTSQDEHGHPAGFEIEILQAIADDQKFGLELIPANRSSLYPDLEKGKYQILAASLKSNPERLEKSDFTAGFAQSYHAILSKKDKVAKSGNELAKLGVTAVQEATNSQKKLEEMGVQMNLQPSVFAAFKEFMAGKADHVTGDSVALGYYLSQHATNTQSDYVFSPFDDAGPKELAYAVTKGNTELLTKMNTGLDNIKKNGKYDEIYNKYFTNPDASTNIK